MGFLVSVCSIQLALGVLGGEGNFQAVDCEGVYPKHLQGICTDNRDSIFWCFTDVLVRTDRQGRVLCKVPVASHHGDLCFQDGKLYVAVNLGEFNQPPGRADSWIYVYAADDLRELARHAVPEVVHGAGGIGCLGGRFMGVGGLPPDVEENYVYEYDQDFRFCKRHVIASGYTLMGIQTATYADGCWWFGCYGTPKILLKTDESFRLLGRYEFDCSLGIVGQPQGGLLVASGRSVKGQGCTGRAAQAHADGQQGLAMSPDRPAGP